MSNLSSALSIEDCGRVLNKIWKNLEIVEQRSCSDGQLFLLSSSQGHAQSESFPSIPHQYLFQVHSAQADFHEIECRHEIVKQLGVNPLSRDIISTVVHGHGPYSDSTLFAARAEHNEIHIVYTQEELRSLFTPSGTTPPKPTTPVSPAYIQPTPSSPLPSSPLLPPAIPSTPWHLVEMRKISYGLPLSQTFPIKNNTLIQLGRTIGQLHTALQSISIPTDLASSPLVNEWEVVSSSRSGISPLSLLSHDLVFSDPKSPLHVLSNDPLTVHLLSPYLGKSKQELHESMQRFSMQQIDFFLFNHSQKIRKGLIHNGLFSSNLFLSLLPAPPKTKEAQKGEKLVSKAEKTQDGEDGIQIQNFEQMDYSYLVKDLAYVIVETMCGHAEPWNVLAHVLTGYCEVAPINSYEVYLLPHMIVRRLLELASSEEPKDKNSPMTKYAWFYLCYWRERWSQYQSVLSFFVKLLLGERGDEMRREKGELGEERRVERGEGARGYEISLQLHKQGLNFPLMGPFVSNGEEKSVIDLTKKTQKKAVGSFCCPDCFESSGSSVMVVPYGSLLPPMMTMAPRPVLYNSIYRNNMDRVSLRVRSLRTLVFGFDAKESWKNQVMWEGDERRGEERKGEEKDYGVYTPDYCSIVPYEVRVFDFSKGEYIPLITALSLLKDKSPGSPSSSASPISSLSSLSSISIDLDLLPDLFEGRNIHQVMSDCHDVCEVVFRIVEEENTFLRISGLSLLSLLNSQCLDRYKTLIENHPEVLHYEKSGRYECEKQAEYESCSKHKAFTEDLTLDNRGEKKWRNFSLAKNWRLGQMSSNPWMICEKDCSSESLLVENNDSSKNYTQHLHPHLEFQLHVSPDAHPSPLSFFPLLSSPPRATNSISDPLSKVESLSSPSSDSIALHMIRHWSSSPTTSSSLSHCSCGDHLPSEILAQSKEILLQKRKNLFPSNLTLHYPQINSIIARYGYGTYLVDENGIPHLDGVNNVAFTGHSNPIVADHVSSQINTINTNSRYLYAHGTLLMEELQSVLPKGRYEKVFFVNSGSEANELALLLSKEFSGNSSFVCMDVGYHGITNAAMQVSAYKMEREGGDGMGADVLRLPVPDALRGRYSVDGRVHMTENDELFVQKNYGKDAALLIDKFVESRNKTSTVEKVIPTTQKALDTKSEDKLPVKGKGVAGYIHESILSCGGVYILRHQYLQQVYKKVREHGGVIIADEVQTGFGRLGNQWWAFETGRENVPRGVIGEERRSGEKKEEEEEWIYPDIITIGKPLGNGVPIAAVLCNERIASFYEKKGMSFFSTYGGCPIACSAAIANVRFMKKYHLKERAAIVGRYFLAKLLELTKDTEKKASRPLSIDSTRRTSTGTVTTAVTSNFDVVSVVSLERGGQLMRGHGVVEEESYPYIGQIRSQGMIVGIELVKNKVDFFPATEETRLINQRLKEMNILSSRDGKFENVIKLKPPMLWGFGEVDRYVQALLIAFRDPAIRKLKHVYPTHYFGRPYLAWDSCEQF